MFNRYTDSIQIENLPYVASIAAAIVDLVDEKVFLESNECIVVKNKNQLSL